MRKIFSLIVTCMLAFVCVTAACVKNDSDSSSSTIPDDGNNTIVDVESEEMEQNYVYMWNQSGVGGADKILKIQSENYALTSDAKNGAITSIGAYFSSEKQYARADFSKLLRLTAMEYFVEADNNELKFNRHQGYHRVIESGRYLQRADYNQLVCSDSRLTGRMELAATPSYVALNYEIYNGLSERKNFSLRFSMQFENEMSVTYFSRGITLRSADGQGITVLRALNDENTKITFESGCLQVSSENNEIISGEFGGFGVIIIPSANATQDDAKILENIENCEIAAEEINGDAVILVEYDARRGIYKLNISDVNGAQQSTVVGRNTYDRVKFTIKNNGNDSVKVPLSFQKTNKISITGISPMIRDAETLEPSGIQVQISKNWHSNSALIGAQALYQGQWYHGIACIDVEKNDSSTYEYTCAYGEWGGVYAAAHAQLCLIGWGGSNNLLWEESSMGSWGESVTYDPDMGLGRSMIDDVRPFLITSSHFNSQRFNWTGNVGGANFLDYYPTAKQSRIVDLIPTYRTQAPCLTDVNYNGITQDGAIKADITINMGRTDDVVRTYYKIKYTFLKDTEPERLSFFKLCADSYADNNFRKYALGDALGATQKDVDVTNVSLGYNGDTVDVKGSDFWFKLYDSSNAAEENGDVSFIVREYAANINGKNYDKPSYRIFGTQDRVLQPSCELTLPSGITKVSAGSVVEMKVEFLVLPSNEAEYYGQSDYLLAGKLFGMYNSTYEQVLGGKTVASVTVGKLQGLYPLTIRGEEGEVAAQFSITGGLGYVPVRINNISGYSGLMLQKKVNGKWVDIVQSGSVNNKNDFWQVKYDKASKTYEFVFNVKNTEGLNYGGENEYRLVKTR